MEYYPVYLDLRDRPCTVVGGDATAAAKVEGLLQAGARVTAVAPELTAALTALATSGALRHLPRRYRPGDLAGAFLAISTLADEAVNRAVRDEAEAAGIPLNVVDDPARCSFIAPAVLRRGALAVAISTSGKAPALAVHLRRGLEDRLGDEHAAFVELAGRAREPLRRRIPGFAERRRRWYRLVGSDAIELLARGEEETARRRAEQILELDPGTLDPAPPRSEPGTDGPPPRTAGGVGGRP